jgi:hypothetical protein
MYPNEIQLAEVAGWRALLTEAQHVARVYLAPAVEDYLLRLLYQAVGQPGGSIEDDAQAFVERLAQRRQTAAHELLAVGDESLIYAGLFPEQVIRKGIPITYFVQVGVNAYREFAAMQSAAPAGILYATLANQFVALLDVLHTLRELQQDTPCIDALNAYQLWREVGSTHAWQVLRQFTSASPSLHPTNARH